MTNEELQEKKKHYALLLMDQYAWMIGNTYPHGETLQMSIVLDKEFANALRLQNADKKDNARHCHWVPDRAFNSD